MGKVKDFMNKPINTVGHYAGAVAAGAAMVSSGNAAVGIPVYLGVLGASTAFSAAKNAPSDPEIAHRNRVEKQENPELRNKTQFKGEAMRRWTEYR